MYILHGENTVTSRHKLQELITHFRQAGFEIARLETKNLELPQLELALGSTSLFDQPKCLIIEELHSLVKSKRKDELLAKVAQIKTTPNLEIILWEKRALTATMIKKFGQAQAIEHKISSTLFKWLESLSPHPETKTTQLKLLKQTLAQEEAGLCVFMLLRQVRQLIQVVDGGKVAGAPFMVAKLAGQAKHFTLPQLLLLHSHLMQIDLKMKTSASPLSLEQELDLLVLGL